MEGVLEKVPGTTYVRDTDTHRAVENGHYGRIMLFAGSASPNVAAEIAEQLKCPLGAYERIVFPNENIFIRLKESVRGQDVYLIQSMTTRQRSVTCVVRT